MVKQELEYDDALFRKMERAFEDSPYRAQVGEYWANYVASIVKVIEQSKLAGFGGDYYLTQGFGDALKYHAPRHKVRKILRHPKLFAPVEKALVIANHRKITRTLFERYRDVFSMQPFAKYMAGELDATVRTLGISRFFDIDRRRAPWRYWMFLIYTEMFYELAKGVNLDPERVLEGNYLDIGGGYGSSVDGMALLKKYNGFGGGTVNYDVDQFPVTFIANQYLKYRDQASVLSPLVIDADLTEGRDKDIDLERVYFRVVQNNVVGNLRGLNISFFFNSNSFQEMDVDQVEEYCRFMRENKSANTYLGAFFYDSLKETNSPAKPLQVLRRHFAQIGQISMEEFFEKRGKTLPSVGSVKGSYYLFDLRAAG